MTVVSVLVLVVMVVVKSNDFKMQGLCKYACSVSQYQYVLFSYEGGVADAMNIFTR